MSRTPAFCDGFTITTPKDVFPDVFESLRPMLDDLGCFAVNDRCHSTADGGLFLRGDRGGISWVQAKGRFVAALSARKMLNEFLTVWAGGPHRVSSADLSVDEFVESPALSVQRTYELGKSGKLAFTRKSIKPGDVKFICAPVVYDDSGLDTGTVYLNRRSAEVHGRHYDKTQERAENTGDCIALTTRHELTVSGKMGITLRDIAEPSACFYHFWPSELLSKPKVAEWVPHAEGFHVERRERLPAQRLKQRVEASHDLGDMIALANTVGPEGLRLLHRYIDERAAREGRVLGPTH